MIKQTRFKYSSTKIQDIYLISKENDNAKSKKIGNANSGTDARYEVINRIKIGFRKKMAIWESLLVIID
jgi:hypothetical protein